MLAQAGSSHNEMSMALSYSRVQMATVCLLYIVVGGGLVDWVSIKS